MYVKNIRHQKKYKKIVVTDRIIKLTLKSHIFSFYTPLKNIMNDNIQKKYTCYIEHKYHNHSLSGNC